METPGKDGSRRKSLIKDEGLSALVRVVILSWSATILTLNYVTILVQQKQIDPTFDDPVSLRARGDF